MIHNVYAIRDAVGQNYGAPFLQINNGLAMRKVIQGLKNPEAQLRQSAKDFTLCHIGEYNDEDGALKPVMPSIVTHITDLVQQIDDQQ